MYKRYTSYARKSEALAGMLDFRQRKQASNRRCKNACGKDLKGEQTSFCSVECHREYMKKLEHTRIEYNRAH